MDSEKKIKNVNPDIKSSLVRVINKGGFTSYIPMLSALCLLLFLIFMMIFWVKLYENHECVFATGPDSVLCCHTHLENNVTKTGDSIIPLTQVSEYSSNLENPEAVTFVYPGTDQARTTFDLDIYYDDDVPSGGVCYPANIGPSAGYYLGTGGVSVYLKYYKNSTTDWINSYQTVKEGVSEFITNNDLQSTIFIVPVNEGFDYVTPLFNKSGNNAISSNASGTSTSYFKELNNEDKFTLPFSLSSDKEGYNPISDFIAAKTRVEDPDGCKTNPDKCMCVDPGAKNLPSCANLINSSDGDKFITKGGLCSSVNCSYASQSSTAYTVPTNKPDTSDNASTPQAMSANVAQGGTLGNLLQKDPTNVSKNLKLGLNGPNVKPGQVTDAYFPSAIFCGTSTTSGPSIMYQEGLDNNSTDVYNAVKNSRVPNSKTSGSTVVLGFK